MARVSMDPEMIDHIDRKRADLGLPAPMYDVPYAPKTVEAVAGAG